jgi:hypothetical protein
MEHFIGTVWENFSFLSACIQLVKFVVKFLELIVVFIECIFDGLLKYFMWMLAILEDPCLTCGKEISIEYIIQ